MYATIIGNVGVLVQKLSASNTRYAEKMSAMQGYMKLRKLPKGLQHKVQTYYEFSWHRLGGFDETSLLNELPFMLRNEIIQVVHHDIIHKSRFFATCSSRSITAITGVLTPLAVLPNTVLLKWSEYGSECFFLKKGSVELFDEERVCTGVIHDGSPDILFGTDSLLNMPYMMTVKTSTYCDFAVLSRSDFAAVQVMAPEIQGVVQAMNDERQAAVLAAQAAMKKLISKQSGSISVGGRNTIHKSGSSFLSLPTRSPSSCNHSCNSNNPSLKILDDNKATAHLTDSINTYQTREEEMVRRLRLIRQDVDQVVFELMDGSLEHKQQPGSPRMGARASHGSSSDNVLPTCTEGGGSESEVEPVATGGRGSASSSETGSVSMTKGQPTRGPHLPNQTHT